MVTTRYFDRTIHHNKMSDLQFQQFLYLVVKEKYEMTNVERTEKKMKVDTVLRIVHWEANENFGYSDHFVIYGNRRKSKKNAAFNPYRLICQTEEQVKDFVRTVIASECNVEIELHQYCGYNDDLEDWYNIDWKNTPENDTTEVVAFDIVENPTFYCELNKILTDTLNVLQNYDVI